jgi:hypothetical protein
MTTTSSTDSIKAIGGLFLLHKHPVSCNCWNHRRGSVLHIALWPQNWSARTRGHRTLFAEVLPFWDSRGKCCERQVGLSRLGGRRGHDWALYWQLFETLDYTLCNGMRLFPRRCLRTVKWSFEIDSFFMKDPALNWHFMFSLDLTRFHILSQEGECT